MATKKIVTPVFRVSFPSVFSPAPPMKSDGPTDPNKKLKYEVTMVFDPKTFTPEDKVRYAAMKKVLDEASMEKFKKNVAQLPPNYKRAFRDGAEKAHLSGFGEGLIFAKASSFGKPGILASDQKTPVEDPEAFYPGCYARASVTGYAYNKGGGMGVAFGLSNLMFVKDGERLDSRTEATDDFGEAGLAGEEAGAEDLV